MPAVVAVDPDPLHLTPLGDLLAADDRNVVLDVAAGDTGVAARALVQIDRHPPLQSGVFHARTDALILLPLDARGMRILLVFLEHAFLNDMALVMEVLDERIIQGVVLLRRRQLVRPGNLCHRRCCHEPRSVQCRDGKQRCDVATDTCTYRTGVRRGRSRALP